MLSVVTGAGGFIGGHLVKALLERGDAVRAVDIKPLDQWWQVQPDAQNVVANLREPAQCEWAVVDYEEVYNLAADMGGMGHIETHKFDCAMNVLISANMLRAALAHNVKRFFFSSSACVYHADRQNNPWIVALKEEDAYFGGGAMPEDGYGWEKLYTERLCRHAMEDYGLETRVARFHNSYGPHGSWTGGREKAPAAICRKVAKAKLGLSHKIINIWGDGTRTRSFMWVGDNVDGILKLMASDIREPLNLGSSECITINKLVDLVEDIAGIKCDRRHDMSQPQGVHGRNSDNSKIKSLLNWEPSTPLRSGLERTYAWVEEQVRNGVTE